jgi:hypothetical protein
VKSRLTTEALIVFLLGGTPLIASYLLGGAKNLEAMIKALITNNNFLTYYLLSLFVAFLLVGSLNWLIWKPTDSAREAWRIITAVLHEAGSGALSIIRIAAGALLTFPLIWLIAEPENFKIEKVAHLILYGIIAYVECVIISGWHKVMHRRARVNL